jgi:hypothetical protein
VREHLLCERAHAHDVRTCDGVRCAAKGGAGVQPTSSRRVHLVWALRGIVGLPRYATCPSLVCPQSGLVARRGNPHHLYCTLTYRWKRSIRSARSPAGDAACAIFILDCPSVYRIGHWAIPIGIAHRASNAHHCEKPITGRKRKDVTERKRENLSRRHRKGASVWPRGP